MMIRNPDTDVCVCVYVCVCGRTATGFHWEDVIETKGRGCLLKS